MVAAIGAGWLGASGSCATHTPSFFDEPTQPLPYALSELGIRIDRAPPSVLFPYTPVWPLWSSGSDKVRLAFLPDVIDTAVASEWVFPTGSSFFKTFSYGSARPVETRVLRRLGDAWTYDVYLWDRDGSDAYLVALEEQTPVAIITADGASLIHRVPSRQDCRACHESAVVPVLGFAEVQLADETLAALDTAGLRSTPTASPDRVHHDDVATQDVLGLLHGNCVHCHNGGDRSSSSFDLRHPVALANTIGRPTESSASAEGIRIVPGAPEQSILFLAYSGETDDPAVKPMPPLGVDRRDEHGIEVLRAWIAGLPDESAR